VTLAGRNLTIGYSDRVVGRGLDVTLKQGEVLALLGGGYLLLIDTLARTMAPIEIPLGILTAVIGTPFFIWLLASMQRNWS
jgi:ABC-type Fe3+-siderophore transport system permease subunit